MTGGIKREFYDEFQSLLKKAKKTKMIIKEMSLRCDPRKFHFNLLKNYLLAKKEGNFKGLGQSQNLPGYDTVSGFDKEGSQENWTICRPSSMLKNIINCSLCTHLVHLVDKF